MTMKKLSLFSVLLLLTGLKAAAQAHLKDVQATSIWAPANVKIDGKINEWEDSFQAYNKSTKLFYTISNNDKYLYLAVTCTDATNNAKIVAGGITFTINTAGKKKDKDAFSLTFPLITRGRGRRGGGGGPGGQRGGRQPGAPVDTAAVLAARKQLVDGSKEIKVLGFKDVEDTVISIYNEYGIKSAIGYDELGNYSYELAVPLKLLNISLADIKDIAYNVKVNGLQMNAGPPRGNNNGGGDGAPGGGGNPGGGGFGGGGGARGGGPPGGRTDNTDREDLTSPTDFWGKYTFAKK
jgi:hypothetical protein